MEFTRRAFIEQAAGVAGLLAAGCGAGRELSETVLVNHVGFTPASTKCCLIPIRGQAEFDVVEVKTGKRGYRGSLVWPGGDLGEYGVGRFDAFQQAGEYRIEAGRGRSGTFVIGPTVYDDAIRKSVSYFAKQRCGDSKTGHHAPCHLDDGRRSDNHQHQDVTGGWHDACDLRRWVQATIYGMIGLSRIVDLAPKAVERRTVLEELRWGNRYFRKMQEPDGYVMFTCGGDDGNNYTNNIIGDEDDRVIHVEPAELPAQFQFVGAQAAMARFHGESDPDYSAGCLRAARKCLEWCVQNRSPGAALSLAAAVMACVEMHKTTGERRMSELAGTYLQKLISLQVVNSGVGAPSGFFLRSPDDRQPLRESSLGNLPLIGLCEALAQFPSHPDAAIWRGALERHCKHLLAMSERSAFGTIPFGLYRGTDPGGGRRIGDYEYRWFMKTRDETSAGEWWVGVNAHLASNGIGLLKAGRLLGDKKLTALAQRQMDWIMGVNPFGASTISGVGRNQPKLYRAGAFSPPTPEIPGGVMNGIGGDDEDRPVLDPGSWNTCEYWTPMTACTLWLCAELQKSGI